MLSATFLSLSFAVGWSHNKAIAATTASWGRPLGIDGSMTSLSCIYSQYCVAVDSVGNYLEFNGTSWSKPINIDGSGVIMAVSCVSTSFCMAVDNVGNAIEFNGTGLDVHFKIDGSNIINSVSCVSTSFCMAVDNVGNAIEFNGTNWETPTSIDGTNSINAISCVSSYFCVAVTAGNAINFEVTTWQSPVSISVGIDPKISCVTTYFCMAVDFSGDASEFNLSGWSNISGLAPVPAVTGINCVDVDFCMAATASGNIWTFNGSYWSETGVLPLVRHVTSIDCPTINFCMAADNDGHFYEFNGTSWNLMINTDGGFVVNSVSCVSENFCNAVDTGGYGIEYNGNNWMPPNSNGDFEHYRSVSCVSTSFCMAVDDVGNAIQFNGSSWSAPVSIDGTIQLNSVSCVSTSFCIAVDNTGNAVQFNGTNWSKPANIDGSASITSVSCTATNFCMAVDNTGNAIQFNGSSWSAPVSIDGTIQLNSVSCVSTSFCMAVTDWAAIEYSSTTSSVTVTGVDASSGPTNGGNTVNIYGNGFSEASQVYFGSSSSKEFSIISNTEIAAVVPSGSNIVDVTVTTPQGTSAINLNDEYRYITPSYYFPFTTPVRICDTRPIQSPLVNSNECNSTGPQTLNSGGILNIPIANQAGIPSDATAVVANVTVTDTNANGGFLTVFPGGELIPPNSSNLNWSAGQTVANLVTVSIGPNGNIQAYNYSGSADVIVDIEGYYGPPVLSGFPQGEYVPIVPFRVCDTRQVGTGVAQNQCNNSTSDNPIGPNQSINIQVGSQGVVPSSGVSAVAVNITAISPTTSGGGYMSVYPQGQTIPNVSNVNFSTGQTVPNRAIVGLSSTGEISLYNFNGNTNVAVDVVGYYLSSSSTSYGASFMPVSPFRICDTRQVQIPYVMPNECNTPTAQTLGSNGTLQVQVGGLDSIPAYADAIVANVTATDTNSNSGYLTLYPSGTLPTISDLNWNSGVTVANECLIKLSAEGYFNAYNYTGSVDIIVDVAGYFILPV